MSGTVLTVLLVDDHAVVREGYRRRLEQEADMAVVGEAAEGTEALQLDMRLKPQVVVLDIALPGVSGVEVLRRLIARREEAKVLVFSMHHESIFVNRALQAGALGFLSKSSAPELLVEGVRRVAAGQRFLSPDIEQATRSGNGVNPLAQALSARELEVLRLLIQGFGVAEIAQRLGLSTKTAANHQYSIKQKLGASSALQLMLIAQQHGLVGGP